jgi:NADH:ubiquinone oxidoreductase subunit F (NADH-binding)/ferredoxin
VTGTVHTVMRVGDGRLTAGLDRHGRLDLSAHRATFGPVPVLTAAGLIAACRQVDLRGRGGAAFPVARKLSAVAAGAGRRRPVVVVNATEGEPGSGKDKFLLARSPHLVLDGAMLAAGALSASEVIVAVAGDGPHVRSVCQAVAADPAVSRMTRVVALPDRFVSGESGALINGINGNPALPPGVKVRASDAGVGGAPTLLSNAETFAQLAALAMLGPAGFASAGIPGEPGTVLLTVGGSVQRPAVVETPTGVPLGHILDICGTAQPRGVLVGGYHGMWLSPDAAFEVPVSRAGLAAGGGTLGAGVVLVIGQDSCPMGEITRVAGYLAAQSAGQCGPCKLGLPAVARSLAAITGGAGGPDELEAVRRVAAGVRGRGACHHPDGTASFVASALDVFGADLAEHMFRGSCGRPCLGVLPLPASHGESRLTIDWTRCRGHGLCARLVPELIQLDEHGYPGFLEVPVPFWLSRDARQAVDMCPALALTLTSTHERPLPAAPAGTAALRAGQSGSPRPRPALPAPPRSPKPAPARAGAPSPGAPVRAARPAARAAVPAGAPTAAGGQSAARQPEPADADEPPTLTGRALRKADLASATAWLAELGGRPDAGDW